MAHVTCHDISKIIPFFSIGNLLAVKRCGHLRRMGFRRGGAENIKDHIGRLYKHSDIVIDQGFKNKCMRKRILREYCVAV